MNKRQARKEKNLYNVKSKLILGKLQITIDNTGEVLQCWDKMVKRMEQFYVELNYTSITVP